MNIINLKVSHFFSLICFCLLSISSNSYATIVTSIKPIGLITAAIADQVDEVKIIVPNGGSPHQYALKPSDVLAINSASLIIWISPELEGFMIPYTKNIKDKPIIEISSLETVKPLQQFAKDHDHKQDSKHHHGKYDMHVWLSPEIANQTALAIYNQLLKIYPEKEQVLRKNLSDFEIELQQTTKTVANNLNKVENSGYFVFHPAYGYFESNFNLKNLGSITLNPSVQPGVKTVLDIQNKIKEEHAVCIFSEPQFDARILNKIVENSDVKIGILDPLGIDVPFNQKGYFQLLLNLSNRLKQCLQ